MENESSKMRSNILKNMAIEISITDNVADQYFALKLPT